MLVVQVKNKIMSSQRVSVFPHNKPITSSRVLRRSLSRGTQYKIHKISLIYVPGGMCRSVQTLVPSWRHHKRGNQVCTETRPGCSLVENVRFNFFLVVNVREGRREKENQTERGGQECTFHALTPL